MGLLSKLNAVSKGIGFHGFHGFDSIKDAITNLDDNGAAVFGTAFKGFKKNSMVKRIPGALSDAVGVFTPGGLNRSIGQLTESVGAYANAIGKGPGLITDLLDKPVAHIPEPLRHAIDNTAMAVTHTITDPIKDTAHLANVVYDRGISQPLSAIILGVELLGDEGFQATQTSDETPQHLIGDLATAAWQGARHISPGQAIGYAVVGQGTPQLTNQEEVDRLASNPVFNLISGGVDAFSRVKLDPVALVAGGVKNANRALTLSRTVKFAAETPYAVDTAAEAASGATRLFNETRKMKTSAELLHQVVPSRNVAAGSDWASVLHEAATTGDDVVAAKRRFNLVLRAGLGNEQALGVLIDEDTMFADRVATLQAQWDANTLHLTPDPKNPLLRVQANDPGAEEWYPEYMKKVIDQESVPAARASRVRVLAEGQSLERVPRITARNTLRSNVTRSEFYQNSRMGRTLRVFTDINPVSVINLHASDFNVQVNRLLTNVGVDLETRDAIRSMTINKQLDQQLAQVRFGLTPEDLTGSLNNQVITVAEAAIYEHVAAKTGLNAAELRAGVEEAKAKTIRAINGSEYDAVTDTTRLQTLNAANEMDEIILPFHPTQFQNYASLPDYKFIRDFAKTEAGKWGLLDDTKDAADMALAKFHALWKPTVLFGTRTPLRIIGEEHLRTMSKFGALTTLMGDTRQIVGKLGDKIGLTDEGVRNAPPVSRRAVRGLRGVEMPRSMTNEFGERVIQSDLMDQTAGALHDYGATEHIERRALQESIKNWKSLSGADKGHIEAWVNDVNHQIRQSPLGAELLRNGGDIEATKAWMRNSDEGRILMRSNKIRARDAEGWAMHAEDQIQRYLPNELRDAAAAGPVKASMLEEMFPTAATRPNVHGQALQEAMGRGYAWAKIKNTFDTLVDNLSTKPDIFLSRQPFFDHAYRAEIARQVERSQALGHLVWDEAKQVAIAKHARNVALGQVRETLYDLAEYSRFAEAFRFVAPFANATREVITTWGGIALHEPAFVRRMQIMWTAPEKAGLIYDSAGNKVHGDGTATAPDGSTVKAESGRYFRFHIPDYLDDAPLLGAIIPNDLVINKDSLNTILANPLGVSPLVNIAAGRLVHTPELETALKPFFPYGIDHSVIKGVLPSALRTLVDQKQREDMTFRFLMDDIATYEANGRIGPKPSLAKAQKKEWTYTRLQAVAKMTLPVSIKTQSPMQPYIDAYRQLQKKDPEHAMDQFIEKFGVEYVALTESMTKTLDHVPPTLEAWKRRGDWAKFIGAHPELGALAIGEVNDEFNPAVFDKQNRTRIGPNDDRKQRERLSLFEAAKQPELDAGWSEFQKFMGLIETARIAMGLPNLRGKKAEELAGLKRAAIAEISSKYKAWGDEYTSFDTKASDKRIAGMGLIVKEFKKRDPSLESRPELAWLDQYLTLRKTMVAALSVRGASRRGSYLLDTPSNSDLADMWETAVGLMVEQSPAFGKVVSRYLDNDKVQGKSDG